MLDRTGKVRAVLADGELEMYGPDGKVKVRILVNDSGSSVEFVGERRGGMMATPKGTTTFFATNKDGKVIWSAPTAGGGP